MTSQGVKVVEPISTMQAKQLSSETVEVIRFHAKKPGDRKLTNINFQSFLVSKKCP
jgi:hypothetical protein